MLPRSSFCAEASACGRDVCGRFAFFAPPDAVARQFGIGHTPSLEPRYNISPTQPVPVVRWDRQGVASLDMLRWGLIPRWAKDPTIGNRMINARAETVSQKPAFRDAFARRRCLILASGFYEWGETFAGKRPFFISRSDQEIMGFAGLWERWRAGTEPGLESCVIITTAASPALAEVHDRMPVILPPDAQTSWLTEGTRPEDLLALLGSVGEGQFEIRQVNRNVNNPSNEGADLIRAAAPE